MKLNISFKNIFFEVLEIYINMREQLPFPSFFNILTSVLWDSFSYIALFYVYYPLYFFKSYQRYFCRKNMRNSTMI